MTRGTKTAACNHTYTKLAVQWLNLLVRQAGKALRPASRDFMMENPPSLHCGRAGSLVL